MMTGAFSVTGLVSKVEAKTTVDGLVTEPKSVEERASELSLARPHTPTPGAFSYGEFLASKRLVVPSCGVDVAPEQLHPALFGQQREMNVWVVLTDLEEPIYANVLRKEAEAERTGSELVKHVAMFERAEIGAVNERIEYAPARRMEVPAWL